MKLKRIALTGAAGRLGSYLREPLSRMADELVSSDLVDDIGKLYSGERYIKADLADLDAVMKALEGADMVVHFGGIPDEAPFNDILQSNIIGCYNVWEAAWKHGARRVVYASSNHAIGMYHKNDCIDADVPHRPDTYYGLAKCFAEDLGRMYWEKRGIEAVCLRIFSCAKVSNTRSLGTWLSYGDLIHLVERSVDTPVTEFTIAYGLSNNDRGMVDNRKAGFLGYRPKDNAEMYAPQMLAEADRPDPHDPAQACLGGPFATTPLGESGVAHLNIVDDRKKA